MKNDNDLILERLRGVPMQKGTIWDRFDPRNPNKTWANDNELTDEARAALERIEARKGEDIDEWAEKLGNDLGQFTD